MPERQPGGTAIGWITFAGLIMIIGAFSMLAGSGWDHRSPCVPRHRFAFHQSAQTWRWRYLIAGAVVFFAVFGVFAGNVLARRAGVIAAARSSVSAFVWMPIYPVWGTPSSPPGIAIVWALTAHGRDMEKAEAMGKWVRQ